jgi:citrate lyase subunit beta/citryl-CoA lyase
MSDAGITRAKLTINDSGALPFVISARLEAAINIAVNPAYRFLPEIQHASINPGWRDRLRQSRLYLPGNNPAMMINAGLHAPDGIILDLEDSVAPGKKDEARILVRNALRHLDFCGAERMVRINQGTRGLEDLGSVIPNNADLILIPKCENASEIENVSRIIKNLLSEAGLAKPVWIMPVIETAKGVENCYEIARCSPDIVAIALGLEDLTADLGVSRTTEGNETYYARTRIINAAKAAGIQPIDSVFSDIADMEGLKRTVSISRSLGFEGMGCIHPRQIRVIRDGFAPGPSEIEKSQKIVLAFESAEEQGLGVVALGSKMIDAPVVHRAQKIIQLACELGLIAPDWRAKV